MNNEEILNEAGNKEQTKTSNEEVSNATGNKERMRQFIKNVRQEVLNILAGESAYRQGAMHFEKGKSGVLLRLEALENHQTQKNIDALVEVATQDFGKRAGDAFRTWSVGIFPPVPVPAEQVVASKDFSTKIKDGFFDLFRIGRISIDPTQIDLLEKSARKLAGVFHEEISNSVRDQLKILVDRMKAKEEKGAALPTLELQENQTETSKQ